MKRLSRVERELNDVKEIVRYISGCVGGYLATMQASADRAKADYLTTLGENARLVKENETLAAQVKVLREIATRPPAPAPPPVIVDNTAILLEGLKKIVAPDVVYAAPDPTANSSPGRSPDDDGLVFLPTHELTDDYFPTSGGWVGAPGKVSARDISTLFHAGDGNTTPPHPGGIVE